MAKISMMKVSVLAMRRDRKKLLKLLQEMRCMQIVQVRLGKDDAQSALPVPDEGEIAALEGQLASLDYALEKLQKLAPVKRGLLAQRPCVDEAQVEQAYLSREKTLSVCAHIRKLDGHCAELQAENARIAAQREALEGVQGLDRPLNEVHDTAHTAVGLYAVENRRCDELLAAASALPLLSLQRVGREQEAQIFLAAWHRREEGAPELLRKVDAKKLSFRETGVPAQEMQAYSQRMEENDREAEQTLQAMAACADMRGEMELLRDVLANELTRERAAEACAGTREAFLLSGWIEQERFEELRTALETAFPSLMLWQEQPGHDENAPVSLRNSKLIQPYEFITDMFSSPGPGDIDPNALMMPFFVAFFGMMVSDAGYGILLSILSVVGLKVLKLKGAMGSIAKVLTLGGVLTLLWGALFGTWFGFELPPLLLNPLQQPVEMLVLCFALGCVHILTGMVVKAWMLIREGKILDALGGQISWFLIFGGGLAALVPALRTAGLVLLGAGVLCLLVFSDNSAGWNIFKRLASGLGAAYGVTGERVVCQR